MTVTTFTGAGFQVGDVIAFNGVPSSRKKAWHWFLKKIGRKPDPILWKITAVYPETLSFEPIP